MFDEAAIFLRRARKEARNIHKGHERNVEAIAEADKSRRFPACVAIKHSGEHDRLIGNNPDRGAPKASKACDDVFCIGRPEFRKNRPRRQSSGSVPSYRKACSDSGE